MPQCVIIVKDAAVVAVFCPTRHFCDAAAASRPRPQHSPRGIPQRARRLCVSPCRCDHDAASAVEIVEKAAFPPAISRGGGGSRRSLPHDDARLPQKTGAGADIAAAPAHPPSPRQCAPNLSYLRARRARVLVLSGALRTASCRRVVVPPRVRPPLTLRPARAPTPPTPAPRLLPREPGIASAAAARSAATAGPRRRPASGAGAALSFGLASAARSSATTALLASIRARAFSRSADGAGKRRFIRPIAIEFDQLAREIHRLFPPFIRRQVCSKSHHLGFPSDVEPRPAGNPATSSESIDQDVDYAPRTWPRPIASRASPMPLGNAPERKSTIQEA